jgi:hypothetical protein
MKRLDSTTFVYQLEVSNAKPSFFWACNWHPIPRYVVEGFLCRSSSTPCHRKVLIIVGIFSRNFFGKKAQQICNKWEWKQRPIGSRLVANMIEALFWLVLAKILNRKNTFDMCPLTLCYLFTKKSRRLGPIRCQTT